MPPSQHYLELTLQQFLLRHERTFPTLSLVQHVSSLRSGRHMGDTYAPAAFPTYTYGCNAAGKRANAARNIQEFSEKAEENLVISHCTTTAHRASQTPPSFAAFDGSSSSRPRVSPHGIRSSVYRACSARARRAYTSCVVPESSANVLAATRYIPYPNQHQQAKTKKQTP